MILLPLGPRGGVGQLLMDCTQLGRSGLRVSRLVLGTMNFGTATSIEDSLAIMDRTHEHGVNFVDTANVYGTRPGETSTEEIVGRWFAAGGDRRGSTVLATKVYLPTGEGPNDRFLSARHIRRACEDSLRRLGTDHVDLYQMHHVDRSTPWEEVWEAFGVLRQQGKVLYFGSSNFAGWHIARAHEPRGSTAATLARHRDTIEASASTRPTSGSTRGSRGGSASCSRRPRRRHGPGDRPRLAGCWNSLPVTSTARSCCAAPTTTPPRR